jgi:hypothetical protein
MIKLKNILLEGGNLFADAVGIKQNEVMPTVKKIETDILKPLGLIGFGTDCFILGSAGKKPADQLSGDLDIGISLAIFKPGSTRSASCQLAVTVSAFLNISF